ncbi:MAG: response regulator transcription factor [Dehalococcoidales bacterium]|nr:response regulator transcription factor [Dehalococcoidales bacterium]
MPGFQKNSEGWGMDRQAMSTRQYVTRGEFDRVEEELKREWKTLLVLLALAVQVKGKKTEKVASVGIKKPLKSAIVAKVLLIDTDPTSSNELATMLDEVGFEVVTTPDPNKGLQMIAEVSLIILDDELPNGEDICLRIRERSEAPIILLGSDSSETAWDRAVAMGADAYLKRTVGRFEFLARIKAILRRYRDNMNIEGEKSDV